jgi:hypothetical protein
MKIVIASDHAGYELKEFLKKHFELTDLGPNSADSVDYPDYGQKAAGEVAKGDCLGIIICGSGIGISIGNDCVVEAGLYVTAGTKLTLIADGKEQNLKAVELSGIDNLLFRRNSMTGRVEALVRTGAGVELNKDLHP